MVGFVNYIHLAAFITRAKSDYLTEAKWRIYASVKYICPTSSNLVCDEGQCVSPWKIPPIIAVKSNVTTIIQVIRFVVNMFYCGKVVFTVFKHADMLKAWGSVSRAHRPLTTGNVRRQFPSLRGTTWRNNGRSAWNGSRFVHKCAFYVEITNIHGVKLKMSFYNRD